MTLGATVCRSCPVLSPTCLRKDPKSRIQTHTETFSKKWATYSLQRPLFHKQSPMAHRNRHAEELDNCFQETRVHVSWDWTQPILKSALSHTQKPKAAGYTLLQPLASFLVILPCLAAEFSLFKSSFPRAAGLCSSWGLGQFAAWAVPASQLYLTLAGVDPEQLLMLLTTRGRTT